MWTLFGSDGAGSAAVEMALQRRGVPYRVQRASTWEPDSAQAALRLVNPMGQIPTLQFDDGQVMTESAAILAELGLRFPASGLLPASPAERAQSLRGLVFIAANCYAAIGMIDYPERWSADATPADLERLRQGARVRLHQLWTVFADQFGSDQPFLGGDQPGALDLLAAVVSRWSGARAHLQQHRPRLHAQLLRTEVQADLAPVFARHWPA
jgi:GST-like protein